MRRRRVIQMPIYMPNTKFKNRILASRNIGPLSHMFDTIETLVSVLNSQAIYFSSYEEEMSTYNTTSKSVCLSREQSPRKLRNIQRWRYGIIVDGTKLSEKYKMQPYSFAGTKLDKEHGLYVYKIYIDTNDYNYYMKLDSWDERIRIDKETYSLLKAEMYKNPYYEYIEHDFENIKIRDQKNIYHLKSKYAIEDDPDYMVELNKHNVSKHCQSLVVKSDALNEREERIILKDNTVTIMLGDRESVDITGCIKNIILPKYCYLQLKIDAAHDSTKNAELDAFNILLNKIDTMGISGNNLIYYDKFDFTSDEIISYLDIPNEVNDLLFNKPNMNAEQIISNLKITFTDLLCWDEKIESAVRTYVTDVVDDYI